MIPSLLTLWDNRKLLSHDESELLCEKLREVHAFLTTTKVTLSEITSVISEIETKRWNNNNPFIL